MTDDDYFLDIYYEGEDAASEGKSRMDCPYPFDSEEGQNWLEGFEDNGGGK